MIRIVAGLILCCLQINTTAAVLADSAMDEASALAATLKITMPPNERGLDPFYTQYVEVDGYPVVAGADVRPEALREAACLIHLMLNNRPDVRKAMIDGGSRMIVLSYRERTTDIPEYRHLRPRDYWDVRARGLGGSRTDPVCSCGEENLLGYPGDPYRTENILIHEFAHNIHLRGLVKVDPTFDGRLRDCWKRALDRGLWKGKYASTTKEEYWAEGVQSWFNNNRPPDHDHNHVDTRAELREYDAGLAALCEEVFGMTELIYTRPETRLSGHLRNYDPETAPEFQWSEEERAIQKRLREEASNR